MKALLFLLLNLGGGFLGAQPLIQVVGESKDSGVPGPEQTETVSSTPTAVKGENSLELRAIDKELRRLETDFDEIDGDVKVTLDVTIFKRTSGNELDFSTKHQEMLSKMTDVTSLISRLRRGSEDLAEVREKLKDFKPTGGGPETIAISELHRELSKKEPLLSSKYQTRVTDVANYSNDLNDTLIQDVHRYQLKNGFRSFMGLFWVLGFVLISLGIGFLIKRGYLVPSEASSMQVITIVLLLFVVLLFGLCDIMGENGVTGLLAALAGYILGKSTLESRDKEDSRYRKLRELNEQLATLREATQIQVAHLQSAKEAEAKNPENKALSAKVSELSAELKKSEEIEIAAIKALGETIERK